MSKVNLPKLCNLHFRNSTGVGTSKLAAESDLASLKAPIDKIDVDKLKTVPLDLSKLGYVVQNKVVKKTVYDKLVAKVNKYLNQWICFKN